MSTRVRNVFVFGSSTVSGMGAQGLSWARHLEHDFYTANESSCSGQRPSPHFYILGVPGDTAALLQRRLESDLSPRLNRPLRQDLPTTSVISVGHTDALVLLGEQRRTRTSIDTFAWYIGEIARRLTHIHDQPADVLYVGLTACNEAVEHTLRTGERIAYSNEVIQRFETVACEVVEGYGGTSVPLLNASLDADLPERFLQPDGIHYAPGGHDWTYYQIKPEFMKIVE